jgi:eukaryotic-like serine/threonine-protein kinase
MPPPPLPRRWIGKKYELIEPVGEGGVAAVWRGIAHGASGFSCRVAIKRVLQQLEKDAHVVELFVEEARVVSQLQHPNIVQVHDFDRDEGGHYFLVMEWVEGLDLEKWVRSFDGDTTPWHIVAEIGLEVLRALHAAHEHTDDADRTTPIIHRDVTPSNILLSKRGIIKLADFGMARAADRAAMTAPGMIKGKLSYSAPELINQQPASARSDLFSLGVVLWEALTGKRLFLGRDPISTVKNILEAEVPSLLDVRPDVPLGLATVVHRALQRNPAARFGSALEMQRAFAGVARHYPERVDDRTLSLSVRAAMRRKV